MLSRDISNKRLLYCKGILFLIAGLLAATILLLENPGLRVAMQLALCIWCFARAYYCAFYVVEHYVDGKYRYRGIGSFVKYLCSKDVPVENRREQH